MAIRKLPDTLANQIAAGEVVERPASVVKELVENALDAGATQVRVDVWEAGLSKLVVTDNGAGIVPQELGLALSRHATSKIATTADLFNIHTFGFRGEALPSIASVARLTLTSRPQGQAEAWQVTPEGELRPAGHPAGTRVEVADLFYATPARRKFLKSEKAERLAIETVIKNVALAHPHVTLSVWEDGAESWHIPAAQGDFLRAVHPRLKYVLGDDFAAVALPLAVERAHEGLRMEGYLSPPTLHAGTAQKQFFFVNGRPIRDRSLQTALKNAYGDSLPSGRHPMAVMFLSLPADAVDVNVHPAKSEVRFRYGNELYSLVYGAVRMALGQAVGTPAPVRAGPEFRAQPVAAAGAMQTYAAPPSASAYAASLNFQAPPQKLVKGDEPAEASSAAMPALPEEEHPLGAALGQIANTYIVAETAEGSLVLVDQHAAHERLVYEGLKEQFASGGIAAQALLLPVTVACTPAEGALVLSYAGELKKLGLEVERPAPAALVVRAVPQLLGDTNPAALMKDVLEDLSGADTRTALHQRLERVLATLACYHSIRAHRRLSVAEQNAILRQMERTPGSLTCNHGRPTVVTLPLSELEKLFERR